MLNVNFPTALTAQQQQEFLVSVRAGQNEHANGLFIMDIIAPEKCAFECISCGCVCVRVCRYV